MRVFQREKKLNYNLNNTLWHLIVLSLYYIICAKKKKEYIYLFRRSESGFTRIGHGKYLYILQDKCNRTFTMCTMIDSKYNE